MMTKLMLIATLTLTIFMTIGAVAQTNLAGADVKVTIPFNFYAGDQSLPAGTYIVKTDSTSMLATNHCQQVVTL